MTAAATFNLGGGPSSRKVSDLARLADAGVDLVGMQEGSDRVSLMARLTRRSRRARRREARAVGWRVYQPRLPGAAAVPIAYDPQVWHLIRSRSVLAVARRWVGPRGAGPTFAKAKRINIAVLRHRETGRVLKHLNTHPIPSTDRDLGRAENSARDDHYADHIAVIRRIVRHTKIPLVLTFDANKVPTAPALVPLRTLGLTGWTQTGTHGNRPIDHVLTRGLGSAKAKTITTSSDHDAVVRELTLTKEK